MCHYSRAKTIEEWRSNCFGRTATLRWRSVHLLLIVCYYSNDTATPPVESIIFIQWSPFYVTTSTRGGGGDIDTTA